MPSTIFTRHAGALALGLLAPAPLAATELAAFPYGCFAREYTAEHLARNPAQSVLRMVVHGGPNDDPEDVDGFAYLGIDVVFADQGQGAEGAVPGETYGQFFRCYAGPETTDAFADWIVPGNVLCHAECDGGTVQISGFDGEVLDLRTDGFVVEYLRGESDCGGTARLTDEGMGSVLFRLSRAAPEICAEDH